MPAGYDYAAKLRIAPAGLSPASTAASLATPATRGVFSRESGATARGVGWACGRRCISGWSGFRPTAQTPLAAVAIGQDHGPHIDRDGFKPDPVPLSFAGLLIVFGLEALLHHRVLFHGIERSPSFLPKRCRTPARPSIRLAIGCGSESKFDPRGSKETLNWRAARQPNRAQTDTAAPHLDASKATIGGPFMNSFQKGFPLWDGCSETSTHRNPRNPAFRNAAV